jgi:OmpA-OmpF porin, OOP family
MNLLSLIENQLTPQTINPISNAIGETPEATRTALGTAAPGILGSLLGKVSASPNGAGDLLNMLKQGNSQGAWSENLSNIAQGMGGGTPSTNQQSLLGSLLGSKLGPVSDFISSHAGVRSGSAMSLLGMAAPLVMGTLGKHVASQGLDAGGLSNLLSSQIPLLKNALPPGLTNTLGINNILSGTQKIAQPAEAAYRQATPVKGKASGGGVLKWAGAAALLALIGWLVASHANRNPVGGTAETNLNMTAGTNYGMPTATNQALPPTGSSYGNADLTSLHLAPGGIGDNLEKAISSGDMHKTVDLNGVTTDSNGVLTDSGKAGVAEIHKVLSAAPNVKVEITGHGATDEDGQNQANAIKNALVADGISQDRVMTSGHAGSGSATLNLVQGQPTHE